MTVDLSTVTVLRITKRFNPECGYTRVVRQDGQVFTDDPDLLLPAIEKYITTDTPYAPVVNMFTYGRVEYDFVIQGMEIRLYNFLDIDPLITQLGLDATGYNWRVTDITYDITETGPITTCSVVPYYRQLTGKVARRTTGNVSVEQAIEKTIDSKLQRQASSELVVPMFAAAHLTQEIALVSGNSYKIRFYVRGHTAIPRQNGQGIKIELDAGGTAWITEFTPEWLEVVSDTFVASASATYVLDIYVDADDCPNWIPLYVDDVQVLDGSGTPVSPNILNGDFETTTPALFYWTVSNNEISFAASSYTSHAGTACLKIY